MANFRKSYVAALVVSGLLLPGLAATLTMILFLIGDRRAPGGELSWINSSGSRAWVSATVLAILSWAVLAFFLRRYGFASRANPSEYEKLLLGYQSLRARLATPPSDAPATSIAIATAHLDAAQALLGIGAEEEDADWRWAAATGYVAAHERLNRAEEALLAFKRPGELGAEIRFDASRIEGSRIAGSTQLIKRLDELLALLAKPADALELAEVHAGVRRIRRTVNEFRDSRRAGLVRARNNLFGTIIFTAVNAYILLGIALIMGATAGQVLAAAVFYLVGAVVGLFRQLAAAGAADTHSEEDFGLSIARLIHTPLFSGLAAVGGVVLTLIALAVTPRPATAPSSGTPSAKPPAAAQAAADTTSNQVPSLKAIFDLNNPTAVVIAAIFGLTPGLLMSRLYTNAEKFKVDLRSTGAAEAAPNR